MGVQRVFCLRYFQTQIHQGSIYDASSDANNIRAGLFQCIQIAVANASAKSEFDFPVIGGCFHLLKDGLEALGNAPQIINSSGVHIDDIRAGCNCRPCFTNNIAILKTPSDLNALFAVIELCGSSETCLNSAKHSHIILIKIDHWIV